MPIKATQYPSDTPLKKMAKGGYMRCEDEATRQVMWFFRLPCNKGLVAQVPDSLVQTIDGLPLIRIRSWELDRTYWRKIEDRRDSAHT